MFGKLAGLFIETEEEPKKEDNKEEPAQQAAPPQSTASQPTVSQPTQAPPVIISGVNEEMAEFLFSSIQEADLPGFDYPEFKQALNNMSTVALPENQKFQTVFATASTLGLTKEKLVSSIEHYQEVINKKKEEFGLHVQSMIENEISSREALKAQKEQTIAELNEQIQKAQMEIASKQQEVLQISNEINEHNLKIQQTASSFEATYNFVSGKLEEDKNKVNSYIS